MTGRRFCRRGLLASVILVGAFGPRPAAGEVVINEILYHPASDIEDQEWIEILNTGPGPETLTGWQFGGAITYTFPAGKTIAPGGYVVVAKSVLAFQALYPTSTADVIGGYSGRLNNAGETLLLYNGTFGLVDSVAYDDEGHWPKAADGDGPSLELINPDLDNAIPQSWAAGISGGTPGLPNSQFVADPAPFLILPAHSPAVPGPGDAIAITVYAYDNAAVASVRLFYRQDEASPAFQQTPMLDDGAHGDGAPGDRVYGALLPAQPQGTILEFWMRGSDGTGHTRDAPASAPTANFLLQVDNEDFSATSPTYRVVMKAADHEWLHTRNIRSDELVSATFIHENEIYYNIGVRFRGKGSRSNVLRYSYRVQFTEQEPFHDIENLNLNAQYIRTQFINMDLMRRIGIPTPATQMVYLVFKYHDKNTYLRYDGDPPGEEDLPAMGWRIQMQDINKRFLREWFPDDFGGNLYRGVYCNSANQADLTYLGPDENTYRCPYEKKTNKTADDFSDVIELCDVFTNTPDALITPVLQEYIDIHQWTRFWGGMAMVNVEETDIYNTRGDDYFLYFDPATSPPLCQAKLLPWDLDEANPNPNESLFVCSLPRVNRFARNPDFTPKYFYNVQDLLDHHYREDIEIPLVESLAPYGGYEYPAGGHPRDTRTIEELKGFVTARIAYLESVISRELTVDVYGAIQVGEEYIAAGPSVTLSGRGLTAYTRWVTVNDNDAGYRHLTGDWGDYMLNISPGMNTAVVECLTTAGVALTTKTLHIRYVTAVNEICGTLTGDTVLTEAGSPYIVTCDVIVPDGVTLAIEPGASILFLPGFSIISFGRLLAEGTAQQPIHFTYRNSPTSGPQTLIRAGSRWKYNDTGTDLQTAWHLTGYDDTGWSSGPAQLGYGDGDEVTRIFDGGDPTNRYPCYYFRHRFDVASPGAVTSLILRVLRDDGCVVYLNGPEVWRSNMQTGPIVYGTYALVGISGAEERAWHEYRSIDPGRLVAGPNVMAVEVHQNRANSSDVSFDLELTAEGPGNGARWGVVAINNGDVPCRLSHCVFTGGSTASRGVLAWGGMVSVVNTAVEIADCTFRDYSASGLEVVNGSESVSVRRCSFEAGGADCIRAVNHPLLVETSVFAPRTRSSAAAVSLSGQTARSSLIRHNDFLGSVGDTLAAEDSNATFEFNTIQDALGAGMRFGSGSRCSVNHNVLYDCGSGLVVRNGAIVTLDHNTLNGHAMGVLCLEDAGAPGSGGATAAVVNTIVWGCATTIQADASSTIAVTYSDVEGGYPGAGNFDLDPAFVDVSGEDFHIQDTSPCRDRGQGGTYVGAFPVDWTGLEVRRWKYY